MSRTGLKKAEQRTSSRPTVQGVKRQDEPAAIASLYRQALRADRTGPLYGAFPYPTKISPEAIALFIASHTKPGDTVLDGFAGSGTTGLAALLCENPSAALRKEAADLGLNVRWGARNAVLYELGALGSFVGRTLTNPPDPDKFRSAVTKVLAATQGKFDWMYEAVDPQGVTGELRHAIWSDVFECPDCQEEVTLWDACVSLAPAKIRDGFTCSHCGSSHSADQVERLTSQSRDGITGKRTQSRVRRIARIYGATGTKKWSRAPTKEDQALVKRILRTPIPKSVPNVLIPWGDLYRSGYHQGISHLHHFYTRRNLIVFAQLWEAANKFSGSMRDALQFWLLSYNASHATIMTRVVAKTAQKDLVVTSAQPGVLYVSGLPVEKNLFLGLRRKAKTIEAAFKTIHGRQGKVEVVQGSSGSIDLPDMSIDYVFTDPPFGGNIPYAEINFINEAWLRRATNRREEAIISSSQGKTRADYQTLLTKSLSEMNRVLKPNGKATVVFHSASAEVWNALQSAYSDAGWTVEYAGVLNKTQGSFKQVTTNGAVRGDPLLLLGKKAKSKHALSPSAWIVAEQLCAKSMTLNASERTAQRLYSRLVNYFLTRHQKVPMDAEAFYRWYEQRLNVEVADCASL